MDYLKLVESKQFKVIVTHFQKNMPKNNDEFNYSGIALAATGNFKEAERVLSEGLAKFPNAVNLAANLAHFYTKQGKYHQSLKIYEKLVLNGNLERMYVERLCLLTLKTGELESALTVYDQIEYNSIDYVEWMFGDLLLAFDHLEEAKRLVDRALILNEKSWEAINILGCIELKAENYRGAIAAFQKAMTLSNEEAIRFNYGNALIKMNPFKAIEVFQNIIKKGGNFTEKAEQNLAIALERDQPADALKLYMTLINRENISNDVIMNFFDFLARSNNFSRYRIALDARISTLSNEDSAFLQMVLAFGEKKWEKALKLSEALITQSNSRNRKVHHIKSVCLDKLGDYGNSWINSSLMNDAATKSLSHYQMNGAQLWMSDRQKVVHGWPKERYLSRPDFENLPFDIIFLVGFPRSGTTMLDNIFRGAKGVSVLEEKPTMSALMHQRNLLKPVDVEALSTDECFVLRRMYVDIVDKYIDKRDTSIVIDKMPLNLLNMPLICRLFPEAKILRALRHPYDCILSALQQDFTLNSAMIQMLSITSAIDLYDVSMKIYELSSQRYPNIFMDIYYEDVVDDIDTAVKKMFLELNVPFDPEVLNFNLTAKNRMKINTPSATQVTEPLYTTSLDKWRNYDFLFTPGDPKIQHWIRKFGYSV